MRRITVDNALVDTGATPLALPTRMIQQLGLTKSYEKRATSSAGTRQVAVVGGGVGRLCGIRNSCSDKELLEWVGACSSHRPVRTALGNIRVHGGDRSRA